MGSLFSKEEANTSRQIEFDIAKVVCILGMVFVHTFEELGCAGGEESAAYYIVVTVLDAIFGAGTFMGCMGLGIAYNRKTNSEMLIKRGMTIFVLGYVLNILRGTLPEAVIAVCGKADWMEPLLLVFCTDIMPFAGLALLLFGLLKKWKFSDRAIFLTALAMSVLGSFVRSIDLGSPLVNEIAGTIVGTIDEDMIDGMSVFPLLNWFIIVVIGYLYGRLLRRCTDKKRYYAIALPVSTAIIAIYAAVAIPRKLGMMNPDIQYYYHFTTPNALILFFGMVLASSLYYYLSLLLGERAKQIITRMSSNLNRTYCIHWVILGFAAMTMALTGYEGVTDGPAFAFGIALFVVASILAEVYSRWKEARKA